LDTLVSLTDDKIDYGLYQIYGKHPVYGSNVLLYIGKADQQTIGRRVSQENWLDTNDSETLTIYVGRLAGERQPTEEAWSKEIDIAEKLLIYVHKPAYNSKSLNRPNDDHFLDVHILNWGDYRDLFPEVSGFRWTNKLDDIPYETYRLD
jgi:hypothetical protein